MPPVDSSVRAVPLYSDSPARRATDLALGVLAGLLLVPVLVALALLVRTTSAGPAIFRQERVGRDGRPFTIWKYRTMVVDADRLGAAVSGREDPRVTRVGRMLRASRLDELPQLVNVLRGEMTIVGPRPEVPRFIPYYTPSERRLLAVRPGVIGPGALLFAGEQADELDVAGDPEAFYVRHHLHPRLALDLDYLAGRGLRRDLGLVCRAIRVVLVP
ncbi:sugar transferase [Pseudonocardia halophobica]|uniref:sugar transferase n=1 Tax=Pseudonocardia halophobica TaxID=29401 RepID=UPI003D8C709E